ncbi:Diacetylchitobiose uptake system permease protein NgcG [Paenibacillus allorhizoplanae]|uniref:Diacetylchitobiose uptake system permease protein NgcG n=1 Tax=Paenibacillus allorhizoplanae TaxID=2905648 RepID=A0ABM9BSZ1_9BACL|nr:carbohydrate ABC transporter permease [Paenibacillus allorhizoplanae]CAH1192873.1 Diacetylchitobiose uptake system permease protein NgcG [Paenibacillus allorhizoplanae]
MNQRILSPVSRIFFKMSLIVWSICVLYPLIWTVLSALKNNQQFFLGKPWDLPKLPLLWSNFTFVWEKYNFAHNFMNSLVVTIVSTAAGVLLSATTAYVIARFSFRGNGLLYYSYLAYMMIPTFLGIIPLFFLLSDLHLTNHLLGLIFVYTVTAVPFAVFVLVSFFKSLPYELEEAAAMDGASHYGIFFRIMLPLAKPGLMSVAIITVLNIWNEYVFALILMNDPTKYTIPVAIAVMQGEMQYRTEWGPLFAALILSMGPTIVFFILFQKQITGGITAGALKG